jgi:hypothetical protein
MIYKMGKKIKWNKMMQSAYLKGADYCEHHHYHCPYTRVTNNNFSRRNLNEA